MDADQNRLEFKFLLPAGILDSVRSQVAEQLEADRDTVDGYQVQSDYFDSDDRDSYWQKVLSKPNRRRIRTRTYVDPSGKLTPVHFIEIKHKLSGQAVKRRMEVDEQALQGFLRGEIPAFAEAGDDRFRDELVALMTEPEQKPVVRIQYHRWAFDSGPEGTIRITFDHPVRCTFPDYASGEDREPDLELLEPGEAIMEVKTIGSVPYWFRQLIGEHSLSPRGFSKFATALDRYEMQRPETHESGHPIHRSRFAEC